MTFATAESAPLAPAAGHPLIGALPNDAMRVLLCTDLEGFTSMVERLGDAAARDVMRLHNRMLRVCLRRHSGAEVTHTGDGVLAEFRTVADALECASDIQLAFRAHNDRRPDAMLRVRIGLHAGVPLREEGRLFGSCINVTVRVCASAGSARILVSDHVRALAASAPAIRRSLEDRGMFSLKGVASPLRLYELAWR